ncbi:MAG: ECF transporter S component [Lachnospira sp.]
MSNEKTNLNNNIKFITITAVFIALTYVFTAFVNIRLPIAANGGLVHLGNVPLFIGAIIFGKKTGAIAGGVGMGLFDLLSGWTLWAPFTFVIVALMGFAVGAITEKHHGIGYDALAIGVACIIKVVGYYIAEIVIYGNWLAPMASIPGNLVQIGVAAVIVLIVVEKLRAVALKASIA